MKKIIALALGIVFLITVIVIEKNYLTPYKVSVISHEQTTDNSNIDKNSKYPENGLSKYTKVNLNIAFYESITGKEWMEYAISSFEKKFPNVKISLTSSYTISSLIQSKINAGNNEKMYDIFSSTDINWERLAYNNQIEKLDSLWNRVPYGMKGKTLKDLVYDNSYEFQNYKEKGHVYSIPASIRIIGLTYHKEYFQQMGWNQSPKTYSEFMTLCEKIKSSGIYPMSYYDRDTNYDGYIWGLMRPKKFEIASESGNTSFDNNFRRYIGKQYTSPENLEMWSKIYDMGKRKYFQPGAGTGSKTTCQMLLIQHKVAMIAAGNLINVELKNNVGNDFTFGFMAMPFVSKPTSKIYIQQVPDDSLLIWSGKADLTKKWCKEFVLWLETQEVQTEISKAGMIPIRKDIKNDVSILASKRIVPIDSTTRFVKLNNGNLFEDNAAILENDAMLPTILGKRDPKAALEKAEALLQKAVSSVNEK